MGLLGDVLGIGASIIGGNSAKKASKAAQAAQVAALNQATGQVRAGNSQIGNILSPYTTAGAGAQSALNDLLGIQGAGATDWTAYLQANPDVLAAFAKDGRFSTPEEYAQYHYNTYGKAEGRDISAFTTGGTGGADAQAAAIAALRDSPLYQSLYDNGEEAILQNRAATGGLRGGNIQGALANFGRDTLSSVIQNQISNLSGVAGNGLSAANAQAGAVGNTTNALANLFTQTGDVNAGGILQRSAINGNMINQVASGLGSIANTVGPKLGVKF